MSYNSQLEMVSEEDSAEGWITEEFGENDGNLAKPRAMTFTLEGEEEQH